MRTLSRYINLLLGIVLMISCATAQRYECPINTKDLQQLKVKDKYVVTSQIRLTQHSADAKDSISISGKVFDRISGEPIPAVVNIVGQSEGTMASVDGTFNLRLRKTPFQLEFIHIGNDTFITKRIKPTGNVNVELCLGTTVVK